MKIVIKREPISIEIIKQFSKNIIQYKSLQQRHDEKVLVLDIYFEIFHLSFIDCHSEIFLSEKPFHELGKDNCLACIGL